MARAALLLRIQGLFDNNRRVSERKAIAVDKKNIVILNQSADLPNIPV